ncbi:MAG: hypothetical protein Q8Q84_13430, partial [Hydrogenophaga sp.]|nr:hypothetical protein [Hydrogenophaga sp.]
MSNAAAASASSPPGWADVSTARHRTSPIRWGLSMLLTLVVVQVVYFLFSNPRFEWPVVGKYLFSANVL